MVGHRYRDHLQAAVAGAAAPYGYTLTIWTSGAVTAHARGIPSAADALLLLLGAVVGFAVVGAIAHGSPRAIIGAPRESRLVLWGGFHLPSVGLAIGGAYLVAALVTNLLAWLLVGFLSTSIYLLTIAAQFSLADAGDWPEQAPIDQDR